MGDVVHDSELRWSTKSEVVVEQVMSVSAPHNEIEPNLVVMLVVHAGEDPHVVRLLLSKHVEKMLLVVVVLEVPSAASVKDPGAGGGHGVVPVAVVVQVDLPHDGIGGIVDERVFDVMHVSLAHIVGQIISAVVVRGGRVAVVVGRVLASLSVGGAEMEVEVVVVSVAEVVLFRDVVRHNGKV